MGTKAKQKCDFCSYEGHHLRNHSLNYSGKNNHPVVKKNPKRVQQGKVNFGHEKPKKRSKPSTKPKSSSKKPKRSSPKGPTKEDLKKELTSAKRQISRLKKQNTVSESSGGVRVIKPNRSTQNRKITKWDQRTGGMETEYKSESKIKKAISKLKKVLPEGWFQVKEKVPQEEKSKPKPKKENGILHGVLSIAVPRT